MINEVKNKYSIPMLEKVMELLEVLSKFQNGLTLQEIYSELNYSKTSVFRILATLLDLGYLGRNGDNNRYFISRKLFNLGVAALGESNIVERAIEPMTRLRDEVKESVMLGTLIGDKVILLEQVIGSHSFTFVLKSGSSICVHASAPGKVLFSAQTDAHQKRLLSSMTFKSFNENTIITIEEFKAEIERTKQKGYGVDIEEEIEGVHCIGAPIYNQFGDAIACVWIAAPKGRLPLDCFDDVGQRIKMCADNISEKLGYKPSK